MPFEVRISQSLHIEMLCSRFKQILLTKTTLNNNVQYRCLVNARFVSNKYGWQSFWASLTKHRKEIQIMGSLRFMFKDLNISRLWSVWTRSVTVGNVVKRYRKDRCVREVFHSFRQSFRPKRSLLLYATVACKAKNNDEKPWKPHSCGRGIADEELEDLLTELDGIEELSKQTLFCENCDKRIVLNKEHKGVLYCPCKDSKPPGGSPDGWEPYMEADDVIIWRKEYKPGQGLYAYKVYGRYKDVKAEDFAAVNIDAGYRRKWDNAVAALAVVERNTNGVPDQCVLHWEVLWPRLFANRDYVYLRRHKEFTVKSVRTPHIFDDPPKTTQDPVPKGDSTSAANCESSVTPDDRSKVVHNSPKLDSRPSVHDHAKQKSLEMYSKQPELPAPAVERTEKIYVVISRSCTHPAAPPTRHAIRVSEYWSHMVVRTLEGEGNVGMEYVLTYYDEPAVGGMPSGVTAWAASRATPAFLAQQRQAAREYGAYRRGRKEVDDAPDFIPFAPETKNISYEGEETENVREEDMESSKTGPDMDNGDTQERSTQTEETPPPLEGAKMAPEEVKVTASEVKVTEDKAVNTFESRVDEEIPTRPHPKAEPETIEFKKETADQKEDVEKEEDESNSKGSWWRYIYPPYYLS